MRKKLAVVLIVHQEFLTKHILSYLLNVVEYKINYALLLGCVIITNIGKSRC